ncbi:GNAT family N-acetyltransferase [Halorarum halophilum]|uniref:GNAT family N-acetyltransferase n=1 Tax=Halorarum halophilum TaxID=2743090 RepID=A0A7D5KTG3_9EURY|nr:GNAT family N-acetyltransferase [Halobaculum halophilum]QLG26240.1 GNAT family N-acetyltransferase [Halobaculum halophilum]
MEYAAVPDDHEETYDRVLLHAFAPERGPDPDRDGPDRPASFHRRGMYEVPAGTPSAERSAEDLVTVCGYYDFSARIRGAFHPVGGVAAVASPPEHRRRGIVREMLAELHDEFRSDGVAFAALWPFEYSFYRRLGYARVNDYARLTVPPAELEGAVPPPDGEFVRLSADDWERLDGVYAAAATEPLGLDRTEDWWRYRVFRSWETDPFVYGWERDGELRGYVVYSVSDDEGEHGRTLVARELVGVDREARGHLLRFCRNHDSQVERVRLIGRDDARLFDRLTDPSAVETEVEPGPMFRLVDVSAGLSSLSYPDGVSGEVVLGVTDDHCEWNDGTVELRVDGGSATCEPTDAEPDVSLDVGALSRLAVGSHTVGRLEELGHATVTSGGGDGLETLEAAFPGTRPFLREGF